ncbi:MAG TPA: hypothetical protein DDY11_12600, partial [Leclercia adecarboxylata]|nr:hypothetical protein [Leclercia adecarboxylata]
QALARRVHIPAAKIDFSGLPLLACELVHMTGKQRAMVKIRPRPQRTRHPTLPVWIGGQYQ